MARTPTARSFLDQAEVPHRDRTHAFELKRYREEAEAGIGESSRGAGGSDFVERGCDGVPSGVAEGRENRNVLVLTGETLDRRQIRQEKYRG